MFSLDCNVATKVGVGREVRESCRDMNRFSLSEVQSDNMYQNVKYVYFEPDVILLE